MTPAPIPNSKGNLNLKLKFSGGIKYTRGGKIGDFCAIFDGNRRLSRKRCEIGRWLLWNVNSKSGVPDWMVSFSMTLSDPLIWVSKSPYIYKSIISKTVRFREKFLKNTNRKSYAIYRMVPQSYVWWPWLTSKCVVQVCQHQLSFLSTQIAVYLGNGAR